MTLKLIPPLITLTNTYRSVKGCVDDEPDDVLL
jgi:hypothetical protein